MLILSLIMGTIGVLTGAFIVAVNLLDWAKYRQLKKLWACTSNFWFTACLCAFYCVKIVDFNHRVFFWLKLRISKLVPWMLLGSLMWSLALILPGHWSSSAVNSTRSNITTLPTSMSVEENLKEPYVLVGTILCFCIPLMLGIASITLILTSLFRHTRRMKENASSCSKPRLSAHFGAARMMGCLLLIDVLYLVAECVSLFASLPLVKFVFAILVVSSAPAQSITVILGNCKLRQALRKLLPPWRKQGARPGSTSLRG
ncbi:taste receptor type 2 member 9-like [Pleurodeles waltl]|uniref:taste receptor type 2 member 9-like n=1 Tax=Pleurodeles waltl TaxID=8319 RepID=UPI003709928E